VACALPLAGVAPLPASAAAIFVAGVCVEGLNFGIE